MVPSGEGELGDTVKPLRRLGSDELVNPEQGKVKSPV